MRARDERHHFYRYSGMLIGSQMELPEWVPFAVDPADEVDICLAIDPNLPGPAHDDGASHWDGETLSFTIDDVGRWSVGAGTTIRIARFPGASDAAIRAFTLGSAWAAIGYQRGWAMLHGSCVEIGNKAVLFCGAQEQGKSTMAAALIARGHRLLVDDLARVERSEDVAQIYPSAPRLKLWRDTIDQLDWNGNIVAQDDFRDEKFHLSVPSRGPVGPAALGAIVLLEWGEEHSLSPVTGSAAVQAVLKAATYRSEMLTAMGSHASQAAKIAEVIAMVPVLKLVRPRDLNLISESCNLVEQRFCYVQTN